MKAKDTFGEGLTLVAVNVVNVTGRRLPAGDTVASNSVDGSVQYESVQ